MIARLRKSRLGSALSSKAIVDRSCSRISKRAVQKRFGFDMIAVREGTVEYAEAVAFFAQVRGNRAVRKGILRIAL